MELNITDEKNDMETMVDFYKHMHEENPNMFPGASIRHHVDAIGKIIKEKDAKTILDYGCGQGKQYTDWKVHEKWNVDMPTLFDPAVKQYENKPEDTFDGVVCTDVLEHIPRQIIEGVLTEIFSYSKKFSYLVIAMFPAGEILPDGRNAHVTLYDKSWWVPLLQKTRKASNNPDTPSFILFRHTIDNYETGWL
jgi:hypothetical protein